MKKLTIIGAFLAVLLGVGVSTQPAAAVTDFKETDTFVVKESASNTTIKMGHNMFLAGYDVIDEVTVRGLLFAGGNTVSPKSKSEYAFVAGNAVDLDDVVIEKDLFAAGNTIDLGRSAKIGRDVYAAASRVDVETDIVGDLSVTAGTVTLKDIKVNGNVNIEAEKLNLAGESVEIAGKLTINADAEIIETAGVKFSYGEIEKYEVVRYEITPASMILNKSMSIVGLFVAFAIVLALFPRVNKRVTNEVSGMQFIMDILLGFCALVLIPIVSLLLIMALFTAPAGLLMLLVFIVMIFLAQGFSGLWLGKLLMEKILEQDINKYLEALIGIIILGFASLIPVAGGWIGFFSLLLGMGLIVQTIRRKTVENNMKFGPRTDDVREAKTVKNSAKAKKTNSRKSAKKSTTVREEE